MRLTLAPNALHNQHQPLIVEKVATLIGKNGSGKSLLLQSVFEQKLLANDHEHLNIVCFSSGQNESYSLLHGKYLARQRRKKNSIDLDCFYFDKSWARLLIFLATALKQEGKVRAFLREHGYIDESSDKRDDISTTLYCKFTVKKDYVALVNDALAQEENFYTDTIRTRPFFRTLDSFISKIIDENYTFDEPLSRNIIITAPDLFKVSFDEALLRRETNDGTRVNARPQSLTPEMAFFTQASDRQYFINRSKITLMFKGDLELAQFSDGEYQILFLYALFDLFDQDDTLFLLDEADSHLHHENIKILWKNLHNIKGHAITTTHLLDSITAKENTISHLKFIEDGKIDEANKCRRLVERLKVISQAQSTEYAICSKLLYLVLIDDDNDWCIFKLLAERKGLDISKLEEIHTLKKTSSYDSTSENFGKTKFDWVGEFKKNHTGVDTKHIFLLCDRDRAPLSFKPRNDVEVCGYDNEIRAVCGQRNPFKLALLAWKRREIKHYLLSYTALKYHRKVHDINRFLPIDSHLALNNPADNEHVCDIQSSRVKNVLDDLINDDKGLCLEKLQAYVDLIPPEEISIDIENMYKFIEGKIA